MKWLKDVSSLETGRQSKGDLLLLQNVQTNQILIAKTIETKTYAKKMKI